MQAVRQSQKPMKALLGNQNKEQGEEEEEEEEKKGTEEQESTYLLR